jgi:hypothetical protein
MKPRHLEIFDKRLVKSILCNPEATRFILWFHRCRQRGWGPVINNCPWPHLKEDIGREPNLRLLILHRVQDIARLHEKELQQTNTSTTAVTKYVNRLRD